MELVKWYRLIIEQNLILAVEKLLNNPRYLLDCKNNCAKAAGELNWDKEYESFKHVCYSRLI